MPKSKDFTINPELDLVLERVLDVPRDQIFKAWTHPEILKKWFCPLPWTVSDAVVELYPGGRFFTEMRSPEGQVHPNEGCLLEIVENEKLVFTSTMTKGFRPIENTFLPFTGIIKLEDHPQGTKYTAVGVHKNVEDAKKHKDMGFHEGWGICADQLVALIKKGL